MVLLAGGTCALWDNGCSVYDRRPTQCRAYPFWKALIPEDKWNAEAARCPGINNGKAVPLHKIKRHLKKDVISSLMEGV